MLLVAALLGWSVVVGLSARRWGVITHALLLIGMLALIAMHYSLFGPS